MTLWYYADALHHRHGPLSGEELSLRLARGELDATTLVWREGLPQWQPLGTHLDELGAPAGSTPAVLPADPADVAPLPEPPAEPLPADTPLPTAPTTVAAGAAPVVYAGLWRRAAASIIDGLITSVALYALMIPVLLVLGVGAHSWSDGARGQGAAIGLMASVYAISLLLPALYFAWMQSSRHQATLGKLACGIKVVRSDGSQLRFWRSLLRYGVYAAVVLLTLGIGLLVSGLMAGLTRRKQAPHDLACDTLVVDRWAFTAHPERQRDRLDTVSIVVLALYGICVVIALAAVVFLIGMIGLGQH